MAEKKKADKKAIEKNEPVAEIVAMQPKRTEEFSLPNETVFVRYLKRQKGSVTNKKHVAYGGMLEGSVIHLPAKKDRNGRYTNVLSKNEQLLLERLLSLPTDGLSIYNKEDNYYKDMKKIGLTKEGAVFDLSNPEEYFQYKVLLSYTDLISPSVLESRNRKTYRFEIVKKGADEAKAKTFTDWKRAAYKALDEMENSKETLSAIIRLTTGKKVSTQADHDWLIGQASAAIEDNAKTFVEIVNDPTFKMRNFIELAIDFRAVARTRGLYRTSEGIDLCYDGDQPTIENAISFLNDIKNQDIKLLIESKIKK